MYRSTAIDVEDVRRVHNQMLEHLPVEITAQRIARTLGGQVDPDTVKWLLERVGTKTRDAAYICSAARRMAYELSRGQSKSVIETRELNNLRAHVGVHND